MPTHSLPNGTFKFVETIVVYVMRKYESYPDNWSQRREAVMKRDNYTCQMCGVHVSERPLEADHITPLSEGGSNNMGNLQALCVPCHYSEKHGRSPRKYAVKNVVKYISPEQVSDIDDVYDILCDMFGDTFKQKQVASDIRPFIEYVFGWNDATYHPTEECLDATHVSKEEVLDHYLIGGKNMDEEDLADKFDISVEDAKRAIRGAW